MDTSLDNNCSFPHNSLVPDPADESCLLPELEPELKHSNSDCANQLSKGYNIEKKYYNRFIEQIRFIGNVNDETGIQEASSKVTPLFAEQNKELNEEERLNGVFSDIKEKLIEDKESRIDSALSDLETEQQKLDFYSYLNADASSSFKTHLAKYKGDNEVSDKALSNSKKLQNKISATFYNDEQKLLDPNYQPILKSVYDISAHDDLGSNFQCEAPQTQNQNMCGAFGGLLRDFMNRKEEDKFIETEIGGYVFRVSSDQKGKSGLASMKVVAYKVSDLKKKKLEEQKLEQSPIQDNSKGTLASNLSSRKSTRQPSQFLPPTGPVGSEGLGESGIDRVSSPRDISSFRATSTPLVLPSSEEGPSLLDQVRSEPNKKQKPKSRALASNSKPLIIKDNKPVIRSYENCVEASERFNLSGLRKDFAQPTSNSKSLEIMLPIIHDTSIKDCNLL